MGVVVVSHMEPVMRRMESVLVSRRVLLELETCVILAVIV